MPKLTARAVEAAKPAEKRREIPDSILPGLVLVVQPSGAKSYVLRFRRRGASRRLTLGRHPLLGLGEARERARAALEEIDAGRDPAAERAAPSQPRDMVEDVVSEYLRRDAAKNKTADETARLLRRHVLPAWAGRSIHDLGRRDVLAVLDEIMDAGTPTTANRTLAAVRRLGNWCVERGILDSSFAAGVKPPARENPRDRVLSEDEIRWLWKGAESIGFPFGPLARVLLLTGVRLGEATGMTETELNGPTWTLPAERVKNGRAHVVPLSRPARRVLDEAPRVVSSAGFVFTTNGRTATSGFSRARDRLHRAMEAAAAKERGEPVVIPHFTFHDLRRTCATGLARLGTPVHVVEAVLNHVSGAMAGVAGIYNRHSYESEKRTALVRWADEVERIAEGRGATVVAIHG